MHARSLAGQSPLEDTARCKFETLLESKFRARPTSPADLPEGLAPVFRILYSVFMIRQAEAKDVPALSRLYHQLVRSVAPDTIIDVREDRIEQIRTDPNNFLFVLEMNDRICGSAFLTLCLDPPYQYQPYALLENFVIDQEQQGKGYGTMLAQYVEHFCLHADCSKIMLLSNSKRSEAHTFFEKQGFSSELKKGFVKYRSQLRSAGTAIS